MTDGFSTPEKIAPASPEAEEAVLGSVIINPQSMLTVNSFLQTSDFFIVKNGWVWQAISAVYERGDNIDNLTIVEELKQRNQLADIGGSAYITWLINNTPTHIHAETYGRIVERAAVRRRLLSAAGDIAQLSLEGDLELEQLIGEAERILLSVTTRKDHRDLISLSQVASAFYDKVSAIQQNKLAIGLPTGYEDLDRILKGLRKQTLTLVAGRPGMGKTTFLLCLLRNAARLVDARVALFSLEMNKDQLMAKLAALETGINSERYDTGQLDDRDWSLFTEALARMARRQIYIDDTPAITIPSLMTKCRRMKHEMGLDLVVVDYAQLMVGGKTGENRTAEVSYISHSLKELARELDVPVLAAAQLNRNLESRSDKHPMLSDLAESGSLEQDADVIMFLYRDEYYEKNSDRVNQADVDIAKNRYGQTGLVTLYMRKETSEFTTMRKAALVLPEDLK